MKKLKIPILLLATALNFTVVYSQWSLTGNASTNPLTNFLGTTDANKLVFKVNNFRSGLIDHHVDSANTSFGYKSLSSLTTGAYNSGFGYAALYANTTGGGNTAIGVYAFTSNTDGWNNTATGVYSLANNSSGNDNVANGAASLVSNTTGSRNCATGHRSLFSNTSGGMNTANGYHSLYSITTGVDNTATGSEALNSNQTGFSNVANGNQALYLSTSGSNNIAVGYVALYSNTTGSHNTAIGRSALFTNTTAGNNTALGTSTGATNTFISEASVIGAGALVNLTSKIRLGSTTTVTVETQNSFTTVSDGRFKNNINETDVKGLEFINRLRPVVYNFDTRKFQEFLIQNMPESYQKEFMAKDFSASTNVRRSGFVAQEVEKAAKETGYNFSGVHIPEAKDDNYSLAYSEFVVPLVKAVQELSSKNDEKEKLIEELNNKVEKLQSQIDLILKELALTDKSIKQDKAKPIISDISYLEQNTPNPFNMDTKIRYHLSQASTNSSLAITNVNGQVLKTISLRDKRIKEVNISSRELKPGSYFYSLIVNGNVVDTKQLIITQ